MTAISVEEVSSLLSSLSIENEEEIQKLGDLAKVEQNREIIGQEEKVIPKLCDMLVIASQKQDAALSSICKILRAMTNLSYENDANAKQMIKNEELITPLLNKWLSESNHIEIVRNSCALIANLVYNNDEVTKKLIFTVPLLLNIISKFTNNPESEYFVQFHAIKALGNMSQTSECSQEITKHDGIKILISVIHSEPSGSMETRPGVIRILNGIIATKGLDVKVKEARVIDSISYLFNLFIKEFNTQEEGDDDDVDDLMTELLDSINIMVQTSDILTSQLFETNIMNHIVDILNKKASEWKQICISIFSNIAEKAQYGKKLLSGGFVQNLGSLVQSEIKKETKGKSIVANADSSQFTPNPILRNIIKLIGCVALEDECMALLVKDDEILNHVIKPLMKFYKDPLIQRNACIALGNLCRSDDNCKRAIKHGFIQVLCELLTYEPPIEQKPGVTTLNIGDSNMKVNASFALNNMCKSQEKENIVKISDVPKVLCSMLDLKQPEALQFYAVECIANLCNNCESNAKLFAELALPSLIAILEKYVTVKPNTVFYVMKGLNGMAKANDETKQKILLGLKKIDKKTQENILSDLESISESSKNEQFALKIKDHILSCISLAKEALVGQ